MRPTYTQNFCTTKETISKTKRQIFANKVIDISPKKTYRWPRGKRKDVQHC